MPECTVSEILEFPTTGDGTIREALDIAIHRAAQHIAETGGSLGKRKIALEITLEPDKEDPSDVTIAVQHRLSLPSVGVSAAGWIDLNHRDRKATLKMEKPDPTPDMFEQTPEPVGAAS